MGISADRTNLTPVDRGMLLPPAPTAVSLPRTALAEPVTTDVPPSVQDTLQSPGRPLDGPAKDSLEPRLGGDFSRVRVHADGRAAESARAVGARAYTVGSNIVFGAGQYAPGSQAGQRLLAHELTHVEQQTGVTGARATVGANRGRSPVASELEADARAGALSGWGTAAPVREAVAPGTLQRTPAAPFRGADRVPFDRSKVDVTPVSDLRTDTGLGELSAIASVGFARFNDPAITQFSAEVFDPADTSLSSSPMAAVPASGLAMHILFRSPLPTLTQGRHLVRFIGHNAAGDPIAYADRTFWVWTTAPTGKPTDIAALEAEKTTLEATTKPGSKKSFGEVGSAFTKLKDVTHDLSVLTTGTGTGVGSHCAVKPAGTIPTDCTNIVLVVLGETFTQQGRAADWEKVKKKYAKNTKAREGKTGLSGLDVQAALQSEAGWKGVYWAPDPKYEVPAAELVGARKDEAGFTAGIARSKGTYMKDFGKKGYPGVKIDHVVTNYAPEAPNPGHGTASTTTKDTTRLDKLKKLPFGVMSAHGGFHMTLITYGKVIEVHWSKEATSVDLIEQTDLESWAVGGSSGFHYYASGAIVGPAADIDAAFK